MLGYRYQDGIGGIYPDFLSFSGITTCIYLPVGNGPPVQTGIVYAYADQIYEEVRQIRLRARLTPLKRIAGLGERAFWDVGVRQLAVLKEDKIFVIHVSSGEFEPSSDTELRARRLAALALGKLR